MNAGVGPVAGRGTLQMVSYPFHESGGLTTAAFIHRGAQVIGEGFQACPAPLGFVASAFSLIGVHADLGRRRALSGNVPAALAKKTLGIVLCL